MVVIRGIWNVLRGGTLLVLLAVLFSGVILVACVARLFLGQGVSQVAGKLHLGS